LHFGLDLGGFIVYFKVSQNTRGLKTLVFFCQDYKSSEKCYYKILRGDKALNLCPGDANMKVMFSYIYLSIMAVLSANELPIYIPETVSTPSFLGYLPNRIVVQFDPAVVNQFDFDALKTGRTGVAALDALGGKLGVSFIRQQFKGAKAGKRVDLSGFYKIQFAGNVDVENVAREYAALNDVSMAQPIGVHAVDILPNDSQFSLQWHLNRTLNDADVDGPEAWDQETGDENVIVAILDTGVRYYHVDLGGSAASPTNVLGTDGNIWINTIERDNLDGIDTDGNGFIDDWVGWDFVDDTDYNPVNGEDGSPQDNDPRDFNGHGTHCAGIVAALNNNGAGL
jgi:subtilisin family serine protease